MNWTESERLQALDRYAILDTPHERAFDDIVQLATTMLQAPIGAVNLIAEGRQWFKAEVGLGVREMPLDNSICAQAILNAGGMVVADTMLDDRFACNPLVTGPPGLRFYAGEVLTTQDGFPLGTLCVLDTKPRPGGLDPAQQFILQALARQVTNQLELRLAVLQRDVALKQRKRAESFRRQILDSAVQYAIISMDMRGRVTSWSAGAENVLGWTEQEMLGRDIARIFTPEDRALGRPAYEMRQAMEVGRGDDERWHMRANGERFRASGMMTPLHSDSGLLYGVVKILRDRTVEARRTQRLALLAQASAGLLDVKNPADVLGPLLEQSVGLLGFDQSYFYELDAGSAHLTLTHSTGVAREQAEKLVHTALDATLCGRVVKTRQPWVLADIKASADPAMEPGRRAGLNAYAGFPIIAGGELFGVISFATLHRGGFDSEELAFFGTLASYIAVVRGRLAAAAQLRELTETLENRVEQRTLERGILEEQLRQSQKMEAVGQLTGGIAHDFNNLLTGISGSLELIRQRVAAGRTGELTRYIEAAIASADRAAALTHRLLAFSRRQTLDAKPIDVGKLAQGMAELIQRTVGPAIDLRMVMQDDLWTALCDPNQLENALLNLAINARDAMPEGGILTIEAVNAALDSSYVASQQDLLPGAYIAISVSDNGSGMSAAVLERVFDPFFTTKPLGQGTGLGLSMVYGFAKQSEGHVKLYSEEGQGTSVKLYLPRHDGAASELAYSAANAPPPQAGSGETVLVVDDEELVRMLVVDVLTDLGYAALQATAATQALALLRSGQRIDLLVTDVGLPGGMNGRQLADAGRALRPGLPVLFITGYAETAVVNNGHLDTGMAVITKPFQMDALMAKISRIIGKAREEKK